MGAVGDIRTAAAFTEAEADHATLAAVAGTLARGARAEEEVTSSVAAEVAVDSVAGAHSADRRWRGPEAGNHLEAGFTVEVPREPRAGIRPARMVEEATDGRVTHPEVTEATRVLVTAMVATAGVTPEVPGPRTAMADTTEPMAETIAHPNRVGLTAEETLRRGKAAGTEART